MSNLLVTFDTGQTTGHDFYCTSMHRNSVRPQLHYDFVSIKKPLVEVKHYCKGCLYAVQICGFFPVVFCFLSFSWPGNKGGVRVIAALSLDLHSFMLLHWTLPFTADHYGCKLLVSVTEYYTNEIWVIKLVQIWLYMILVTKLIWLCMILPTNQIMNSTLTVWKLIMMLATFTL